VLSCQAAAARLPSRMGGLGHIPAGAGVGGSSSSLSRRRHSQVIFDRAPRRLVGLLRRSVRLPDAETTSSSFSALVMSSIRARLPSSKWRSAGRSATALASDAQEASKARFSSTVMAGFRTTVIGLLKNGPVPVDEVNSNVGFSVLFLISISPPVMPPDVKSGSK